MSRRSQTLVAITVGALALATSAAEAQTPSGQPKPTASPCPVPDSGFQSCLRVMYKPGEGDSVEDVRMTATLLRRVKRCPARTATRRVTITADDGTRLERVRRPSSCRRGIVSWRSAFSPGETADWDLRKGDTLNAVWSGVRNAASVRISSEE